MDNGSNLSKGKVTNAAPPTRQHFRLATGDQITGESNPNGAEKAPRGKVTACNEGKTY